MAQTLRPSLLVFSLVDAAPPHTISLTQDENVIGRSPAAQVVLADPTTSREHARLLQRGTSWHLSRMPNAGPIFINGELRDEADLLMGDQIVVGATVLRLVPPSLAREAGETLQRIPPELTEIPTPRLVIRWSEGTLTAPLRGDRITLGRDQQSGIIIPSPLVSTHHAILARSSDGRYTLRDEGSVNGLVLQGKRVTARELAHGDVVVIGEQQGTQRVTLTYEDPQQGVTARNTRGEILATIGRDPASTYALASPLISWQHAQLIRVPTGEVQLVDMGSTNGTYVNYQRLRAPTTLQVGDRVNVGTFEFLFDGERLTAIKTATDGMRIDAHHLVRTIAKSNNTKQTLLNEITLSVQPGEFLAIAGGSGAGKTTLMRALAGIQPAQEGQIFFNDVDLYQHYHLFRGSIGYVPQSDIVHGALTVERALYYAARLRLAGDIREDEIAERITAVLETVALAHRRQSVIKDLSGGERKRVNIAVELLADPPIIFLDEPSAALDPNLRMELTETMRGLAAKGRTVVLVTHHVEDIKASDMLAFMGSGGRLCYFGPPQEAPDYFQVPSYEKMYTVTSQPAEATRWHTTYQASPIHQKYVQARMPKVAASAKNALPVTSEPGWQQALQVKRLPFFQQLLLLMRRYVEVIMQDRANLAILLLQAPIIGLLFSFVADAGVFSDVLKADAVRARFVLFFLAVIAIWFGASNAAREICKENDIYERERLAGLGIVPYLLSKIGVLAVLCAFQAFVLLVIVTFKSGISPAGAGTHFPAPFEVYLGLLLVELAGMAMGLCVSAFASTPDKATSLVPIVLIPQILLAGVVFTIGTGSVMAPLADLTISRWGIQALGTSANLNHIYLSKLKAVRLANNNPDTRFDTTFADDFDNNPDYASYAADWNTWNDAVASRRVHVDESWDMMILLFLAFTVAAGLRLRAKDPT
jgi:ABC-type multidrug transport system ATPase subunit/pSer/pThr/pTyr-binding forkhead associated (FHA) protein